MNSYYSKDGTLLGRAWAYMHCMNKEDHKPHSWNSMYTSYGPYMCEGFPAVEIYSARLASR